MPIVHSLSKVNKNLSKSTGQMHVKGRKFKQLNRATLREQKITAKKAKHLEQKNFQLDIIQHIQERIEESPDTEVFTLQDMKSAIEEYIDRFDEEIEEFQKLRRPGRPLTPKHQVLLEKRKYDHHVYKTGFKVPDISDPETVTRLRAWNGTSGGVNVMKFIYVSKDMESLPVKEVEM